MDISIWEGRNLLKFRTHSESFRKSMHGHREPHKSLHTVYITDKYAKEPSTIRCRFGTKKERHDISILEHDETEGKDIVQLKSN